MIEDAIFLLLQEIEAGNIKLTKQIDIDDLGAHYGNVTYEIGVMPPWTIIVFFDCGGWDYLDSVISPEGERLEYDAFSQELKNYRPPESVQRVAYGSPGYLGCYLEELKT